jgi:hypothetical protein
MLVSGTFPQRIESGRFALVFNSDESRLKYRLNFDSHIVVREILTDGNVKLIDRKPSGDGMIWAEEIVRHMKFRVPQEDVVVASRRDFIQHPFIERLHDWAKSLRYYQFGSDMGHRVLYAHKLGDSIDDNPQITSDQDQVVKAYCEAFIQFGPRFDKFILRDLAKVGYDCDDVGSEHFSEISVPGALPVTLFVKERGLSRKVRQAEMSQGMFRAVAIVIQLNIAILSKTVSSIIIDDIGEGLDFDRSRQLIRLLIRKCRAHNIQLFMSTNDRFVMNEVDLKYWQIVHRSGSHVKLINYKNSPAVFDEFSYYGLNNFDFFATESFLGSDKAAQ